jgi:hypothetical protein
MPPKIRKTSFQIKSDMVGVHLRRNHLAGILSGFGPRTDPVAAAARRLFWTEAIHPLDDRPRCGASGRGASAKGTLPGVAHGSKPFRLVNVHTQALVSKAPEERSCVDTSPSPTGLLPKTRQ